MKIDYSTHYNSAYWTGKHTYRTATGETKPYHGPGLSWEGFEWLVDILAPLLPGKTLLDIGCGGGGFASCFLRRKYDAYGVDISDYAIKNCVASMKGRLALADISTDPTLPENFPQTFDVVTATDLLEHIYHEDLDKTFNWIMNKTNRWLFFCVATVHDPSNPMSYMNPREFVHEKGKEVPIEYEGTAISGHVNVRSMFFWKKFFEKRVNIRWERMYYFQMKREANVALRETYGWCIPNTWVLEKRP